MANLADIFTSRLIDEIPPALSALLTALLNLPRLHTVNLSDNAFGLNTQAPLVDFLAQHVPLRHIVLNNNGLGPQAGALIGDALVRLQERKERVRKEGKDVPDLETIICGRNRLENGSMEVWSKVFAAHRGVMVVKMVQNGIRQEGVAYLLRHGLRHASRLKVLDLQDNTFTVQGSLALADVLPEWKDAQELGVGDCLLSSRGVVVLAEALNKGSNPKLKTLRLQYNEMDAKGLKAFTDAATNAMPDLQRVELNGNAFGEEDSNLETLRELLLDRMRLAGVDDDHDQFDQWGLDSLSDLEDEDDDDDDNDTDMDDADGDDHILNDEEEKRAEKMLKDADEAENENVPLEVDRSVDALADILVQTRLNK